MIVSDYGSAVLGRRLIELVTAAAPRARIRFIPAAPELVDRAEQSLTAADVLLVPHGFVADLPHAEAFRDEWVLVADHRHPFPGETPSVDDLRTRPWVLLYNTQTASTPAAQRLRMTGIDPHAQVTTDSFLAVRSLVVDSSRVALLPRRLLDIAGMSDGLRVHPSPVPLDPLVLVMWWHPVYEHDPEHRFLREAIAQVAREYA